MNGKTYHSVMVTGIDASNVSITFQDGTSQSVATKIKLSDLSPERVANITAAMQELKLDMALAIKSEGGGPRSRHIEYEKERPEAVKQLRQHPLKMIGTILYGNNYIYLVQVLDSAGQSTPTDSSNLVNNSIAGRCLLLPSPSRPYTPKQQISITVYPAGGAPLDGKSYPCYTDDANWAYTITHLQ